MRNAGTIGGNICNGATSADMASTLCVFDAILKLVGPSGERDVSINDFYKGPGQVDLKKGEILKGFVIEEKNYKGYNGRYIKFSQRKAMDIATLGCSVLVKEKEGLIEDLKIAFGVAGPTPLRAKEAENFGKNKKINEENLIAIGEKCLESTNARDSWRASKAFREQLIRALPVRGLEIALGG
ncbi:FAD binding domain-containing protein [endosymbiont 'TC1' of Trimyema compressum]|uniref:FAD binding domain-containing protein n=1 Tax=endosymbiont 'TC1' of Trimyema compressum TaxID=243899 RepID=UPI000AFF5B35|nr:FAD binding domain-containing protein [endosymbiont 'TC1' of Trimyema compressum]